jgi:hypothetical protein
MWFVYGDVVLTVLTFWVPYISGQGRLPMLLPTKPPT